MRCCKYIVAVAVIALLGIWGYFVYDINDAYPSPEEKCYSINEEFEYYGLNIKGRSIELYEYEEFAEGYDKCEESLIYDENKEDYLYVVVTLHITNMTGHDILVNGNPVYAWMIETGIDANGIDEILLEVVNFSEDIFHGDFEGDIELPFKIPEYLTEGKSKEDILKEGVKVIVSYYPYKEYISFKK
ncbi:MAG: hypothetical protein ACLRVQ_03990 [Lachnospiraceae bacterium]